MHMIKGIEMDLGGRRWMIPPLNLAALEHLSDRLAGFSGGLDAASVSTVVDAAFYALLRNYPEISRDEVADMIDIANMEAVMSALMNVSGLEAKAGEAKAGEAGLGNVAAAPAASSPTGAA